MYHIPTPEARSCFEKARDFCKIKQFNEALHFLDEALNFYPLYLNVLNQKGVVLCKLGKPKEAIDCFNRAIEIKSNYIRAWNNKG
ncbi:MAG: tetratricopeptide repeat protein [Candidatus Lokiarchaeota archaeon]|nr:tetratricopeptide repeat protein [Candidatus Lokiarchaeota archaeon]